MLQFEVPPFLALPAGVSDALQHHPLVAVATLWPASQIGGEFMPPLDEGDLLYMPSALPGIAAGKVTELLQQTDRDGN